MLGDEYLDISELKLRKYRGFVEAPIVKAAPEMLQALKDLVERVKLNGGLGEYTGGKPLALAAAELAIEHAEGRAPWP